MFCCMEIVFILLSTCVKIIMKRHFVKNEHKMRLNVNFGAQTVVKCTNLGKRFFHRITIELLHHRDTVPQIIAFLSEY